MTGAEPEIRTAVARLCSVAPYGQGRNYQREVPMTAKETPDAYEKRTWQNRMHVNGKGTMTMPAMSFKLLLEGASKFLGQKIPGRGKATWTKHFMSGVLVMEDVDTGIKASEVEGEWLHVPSDGRHGGGSRVWKCFPVIPSWEADVTFTIVDPLIPKDVFELHLQEGGKYIGVGRFRPEKGGYYGRFDLVNVAWS